MAAHDNFDRTVSALQAAALNEAEWPRAAALLNELTSASGHSLAYPLEDWGGRSTEGDEPFSFDFAMPEVADGDGRSSFAFALTTQPEWAGDLGSITLSGPGGSFTLDGDGDLPMTILRDPRTGRIRGFLREEPLGAKAAIDALVRRPPTRAWRRCSAAESRPLRLGDDERHPGANRRPVRRGERLGCRPRSA